MHPFRTTAILMTSCMLAATLLGGCAGEPKPDAATPDDAVKVDGSSTAKTSKPKAASEDEQARQADVNIDERLAKLCNLPEPRFDFDSAAVSPKAAGTLDALAKCVAEGPAKGKALKVVGHADERGETVYNFGLGQRRAGSVAQYLAGRGVPKGSLASSSRGELDATGSDEEGWARDRRVDILLAE